MKFLEDSGYDKGVNKDTPSWLLARGELADSLNMIFDRPGIARQRGGTTKILSGSSQTAYADSIGFTSYEDLTPQLMGIQAGIYNVSPTTGLVTLTHNVSSFSVHSRAVQHFGFLAFPGVASTLTHGSGMTAGSTTAIAFTNTATAAVVAGSRTITLTAPDTTGGGALVVGALIQAKSATYTYLGRVTSITSATQFTVWPVPTHTLTVAIGSLLGTAGFTQTNARCGASFQNRLLLGGVGDGSTAGTTHDRRFTYSILPTEEYLTTGAFLATYGTLYGATFLDSAFTLPPSLPPYNFVDVPGADPFVAMEAVSDNELLILSRRRPVVFRGNLVTQTATTSQQVTFDVSEMDIVAGCSSDHSVQRTSRGVMWAGAGGVHLYTGSDVVNVLKGKMATYWTGLARSTTFAIHGSFYARDHYYVCGTSGGSNFGLLINLASQEYTFAPLSNIDIFSAVPDPTDPAKVFALRWWDVSAAAPTQTGGCVIRTESILDSYVAGSTKTDHDGNYPLFTAQTRVMAGDSATQKIQSRATLRYQAAMPTAGAVWVQAQTKIDSTDTAAPVVSLKTFSNTETRTVSAATNATPIVCTTSVVHGFKTDDFVDIEGGLGNTHVNGRWRITVLSTTTFSLNASTGNGAYTASSATVKHLSEEDFDTHNLPQGQGVSFLFSSQNTVNNFELHGVRVAYYEGNPVTSS